MDQIGLLEMSSLIRSTGGISVLADGFGTDMFQESFKHIFERDETGNLKMGFNACLEIQVNSLLLYLNIL